MDRRIEMKLQSLPILLLLAVLGAPAAAETVGGWQQALPLSTPPAAGGGGVAIETELIIQGLNLPVYLVDAGDGSGRLFIVEQEGVIKIVRGDRLLPNSFLDISERVSCCFEQGLLGLAFSPGFTADGFFYVNYTDNTGDNVISRFQVSPQNPNRALANSEVILKTVDQFEFNHNGGGVAFGPDGMLYSGIGDGGAAGDPDNRAQDLGVLLGKMLRLDPDNPPTYIPADNPFVGDPGALDEIWSYGLRNPWRFSFDRLTGDLIIGDVGQMTREEVDFQPLTSSGGENWGWKVLEGTHCHSDDPPGICDDFLAGDSVLPILEYGHTGGRCSIIGGYRYRGGAFPDLEGIYFYGDFCTGEIFGATEDAPGVWSSQLLLDANFAITTFGEDADGQLYVATQFGAVHKILSAAGGGIPCSDVQTMQARCIAPSGSNRIQARVILTDASHDGQSVTIGVDGDPNVVTVTGDRALLQSPGATSGMHTISLDDPAACVADMVVNCP